MVWTFPGVCALYWSLWRRTRELSQCNRPPRLRPRMFLLARYCGWTHHGAMPMETESHSGRQGRKKRQDQEQEAEGEQTESEGGEETGQTAQEHSVRGISLRRR